MNILSFFKTTLFILVLCKVCSSDSGFLYWEISCQIQPVGCPIQGPQLPTMFRKISSAQPVVVGGDKILFAIPEDWSVPFFSLGSMEAVTAFYVEGDSIWVSGRIGSRTDSVRMWGVSLWDGRKWSSPVTKPENMQGRFTGFLKNGRELIFSGMNSEAGPNNEVAVLASWDGDRWNARKIKLDSPNYTDVIFTRTIVSWNGGLVTGSFPGGIWSWKDTSVTPILNNAGGSSSNLSIAGMSVKDGKLWAWGNFNGKGIGSFDGQQWTYPTLPTHWGIGQAWLGDSGYFLDSKEGQLIILSDASPVSLLRWNGVVWDSLTLEPTMRNARYLASDGTNMFMVGPGRTVSGIAGMFEGLWVARWDGSKFSVVERTDFVGKISQVSADHGRLFIGGEFHRIGNIHADNLAMWDGSKWNAITQGIKPGIGGQATSAVSWSGKLVFGGENILAAGSLPARGIAGWDGGSWVSFGKGIRRNATNSPISSFFDTKVNCLATDSAILYVGGRFDSAGNGLARNIAQWNGSEWAPLGDGIPGEIKELYSVGGSLYVVSQGDSTASLGSGYNSFSRWDGHQWHYMDTLPEGAFYNSLTMFQGSLLASARGTTERWNGSGWEPLNLHLPEWVEPFGIITFKDELYIAGERSGSGLYKYDGSSLYTLPSVEAAERMVSDGENLFVSGAFDLAGKQKISLARWDGVKWYPMADISIPLMGMVVHGDYLYVYLGQNLSSVSNLDYYLRWNRRTGTWSRPVAPRMRSKRVTWNLLPCARDCVLTQGNAGIEAFDLGGRKQTVHTGLNRGVAGVRVIKAIR